MEQSETDALDRLVFAVLEHLPPHFQSDRLHTVLGTAAQILAFKNRDLARTLLEPAMNDRGWLFMGRHFSFDDNQTLKSVARTNQNWALEVLASLCQRELRHAPPDCDEARAAMIEALIEP